MPLRGYDNLKTIDRSIITLFNKLTPQFINKFTKASFIIELYRLPWNDPVKETQDIARSILHFYGIKNSAIKVTFVPQLTMPGRIKIGLSDVFFVDINSEYKNQRNIVIAILAHEVTHIFLHRHRIKFETTEENEILTDTTAAFFGLGPSILNVAYNRATRTGNRMRTTEFNLGYLSVDEFGYVIAKSNQYFGAVSPLPIEPGLPAEGYACGKRLIKSDRAQRPFSKRDVIDRILWWIRSLFKLNSASNDVPIVFNCLYCSQKLRIPANRKTLQVKCSTCGSTQVCYS